MNGCKLIGLIKQLITGHHPVEASFKKLMGTVSADSGEVSVESQKKNRWLMIVGGLVWDDDG